MDKQHLIAKKLICFKCRQQFQIEVWPADYQRWKSGDYIQNAMPYLDNNERELLISGFCGSCFDALSDVERCL